MKTRLIAPAIMLALLVAGCSTGGDAAAEPSATSATTAATPSASPSTSSEPSGQQADDEVFLAVFGLTFGAQDEFSGEELVAMAKEACTKYAAGKPHVEQLADIVMSGMTEPQQDVAIDAISAGIANYCPEVSEDFFGES